MATLTKDQRNQIFRMLEKNKINPSDCKFSDEESGVTVTHVPSGSQVIITLRSSTGTLLKDLLQGGGRGFRVDVRIGDDPYQVWFAGNFRSLTTRIAWWAHGVGRWVDTPNLWGSSLAGDNAIPGAHTPDSANTPFTSEEQQEVSAQLKEIAESIKATYKLTAEQSAKLDEKFEEAEKASRRMGRKDWGLLFGGAVFSLILADVITPGVAGHILTMIEHGIGHLFIGGPPSVRGVLSAGQD